MKIEDAQTLLAETMDLLQELSPRVMLLTMPNPCVRRVVTNPGRRAMGSIPEVPESYIWETTGELSSVDIQEGSDASGDGIQIAQIPAGLIEGMTPQLLAAWILLLQSERRRHLRAGGLSESNRIFTALEAAAGRIRNPGGSFGPC